MSRAIIVAALTALLPLPTLAQQHSFRQHATKDGLAQSQVRAMIQDAQGYLWFGTLGGASRFDGQEFTSYALSDGLPDLQVSAIVRDASDKLLFAAGNAIATWNGKGFEAEPLPADSKGARILSMVASNDRLFVGTDGGGMFVRSPKGISALDGYPSDTATHVRSLALLRDGRLLIGGRASWSGTRAAAKPWSWVMPRRRP